MKKTKKNLSVKRLSLLLLAGTISFTPVMTPAAPVESNSLSTTTEYSYKQYSARPIADQQAQPADNGLYWINEGATYRSGATLQFYATGAGYGPTEPQELLPIRKATRYVPIKWRVVTSGGTRVASGSWKKRDRVVTSGSISATGNGYTPGEYQFKDSFTLSTDHYTSVPYALQVVYQNEIYTGRKWNPQREICTRSVNFYIRNVSETSTPTPTPKPKPAVGTYQIRKDIIYRVTNSSTVTVTAPADRSIKKAIILDSITINGYGFKVGSISNDAFANCDSLKTVTVGRNIDTIGKRAFYGDKNLETISLKTTRLVKTRVGSKAFKGIRSNCTFKVPSTKSSLYTKILNAKGAGNRIKIKKYFY